MRIRIRWRIRALAVIALSAALVSVNVAAADASAPAARPAPGSGLIRYSAQNPSARHVTLTGKKSGGGCTFKLTGSTAAAQAKSGVTTFYHETAYNPSTCQSFIDVSQVKAASAAPARPAGAAAPSAAEQGTASTGQGTAFSGTAPSPPAAVTPAAATCADPYRDTAHSYADSACIHSWFHDPPGIHVNDVTNEVQWNPGSGCANHGRSYSSGYLQWYTTSGWQLYLSHFASSATCGGIVSSYIDPSRSDNAGAAFVNTIFCAATVTYTYYASQITGFSNGSYQWQVDWSKTGLCQNLLTFQAAAS